MSKCMKWSVDMLLNAHGPGYKLTPDPWRCENDATDKPKAPTRKFNNIIFWCKKYFTMIKREIPHQYILMYSHGLVL